MLEVETHEGGCLCDSQGLRDISESESAEGQVGMLLDEIECNIPRCKSDVKCKFEFSSRSYCMLFQSLRKISGFYAHLLPCSHGLSTTLRLDSLV